MDRMQYQGDKLDAQLNAMFAEYRIGMPRSGAERGLHAGDVEAH